MSRLWFKILRQELASLRDQRYPPFVIAGRPAPLDVQTVPVFMFHSVASARFERQLAYLAQNQYGTLSLEDFHLFLQHKLALPGPSVLLTFDDGERSLLTVALPLLQKYGFRATVFITPARLPEAPPAQPWPRRSWLAWPEVRFLAQSGSIDIGAHSLSHARVFVNDHLCGFYRPGVFADELGLDHPWVRTGNDDAPLAAYGAPLYAMAPRLAAQPRFLDDERVRQKCIEWVRGHGGAGAFKESDWQTQLRQCWNDGQCEHAKGFFETAAEMRAGMQKEIAGARTLLEERLEMEIRHFAYPWGHGSSLAVDICKESGYWTNFWGPLPGQPWCRAGQDPFYVPRIKDDYLFRLPGVGRHSLWRVFIHKALRRLRHKDIY